MLSEKSEHEPDEYDPEEEFRDPESDSITIPEVQTAERDAPAELFQTFWLLVFVVNAALLAVALGAMFLVFRGDLRIGGSLLAGGIVLSGLALRRYRSSRDSLKAGPSRSVDGDGVDRSGEDPDGDSTGDDIASGPDGRPSASETVSGADHEADSPEDPTRE